MAIDYLNQIMDSRQPFLLVTENKTFENVVLTGIEYTEEASESLVFDLSFEQIRLVSYGTVNTVAIKTQPSKNIGANMKNVLTLKDQVVKVKTLLLLPLNRNSRKYL